MFYASALIGSLSVVGLIYTMIAGNISKDKKKAAKVALIVTIVLAIKSLIDVISIGSEPEWIVVFIMVFLGTLSFSSIYAKLKNKLYSISYAGGGISFPANDYTEVEIQEFSKAIRQAKDAIFKEQRTINIPVVQQVENSSRVQEKSVAEKISEYYEMYTNGIITEDEFKELKKKEIQK